MLSPRITNRISNNTEGKQPPPHKNKPTIQKSASLWIIKCNCVSDLCCSGKPIEIALKWSCKCIRRGMSSVSGTSQIKMQFWLPDGCVVLILCVAYYGYSRRRPSYLAVEAWELFRPRVWCHYFGDVGTKFNVLLVLLYGPLSSKFARRNTVVFFFLPVPLRISRRFDVGLIVCFGTVLHNVRSV